MSRSLGDRLPPALLALLDGEDLPARQELALLLATVDTHGLPHAALLSVGEVLASGPASLRLALYARSTTSANLRHGGGLLLALAHDGLAYYVKASARERAPAAGQAADLRGLAVFDAQVNEVLEDGEAIAAVTSGFAITLTRDAARTLASWERQIAALRALPD